MKNRDNKSQNSDRWSKTGHLCSNSAYPSREATDHLCTVRKWNHFKKPPTEHATTGRTRSSVVISFVGWIFLHSVVYNRIGTDSKANERKRPKIHSINYISLYEQQHYCMEGKSVLVPLSTVRTQNWTCTKSPDFGCSNRPFTILSFHMLEHSLSLFGREKDRMEWSW